MTDPWVPPELPSSHVMNAGDENTMSVSCSHGPEMFPPQPTRGSGECRKLCYRGPGFGAF